MSWRHPMRLQMTGLRRGKRAVAVRQVLRGEPGGLFGRQPLYVTLEHWARGGS